MNYDDYLEMAEEWIMKSAEDEVKRIRDAAAKIPEGEQGDCELCGAWSGRLVNGACAPCRDRYKLK